MEIMHSIRIVTNKGLFIPIKLKLLELEANYMPPPNLWTKGISFSSSSQVFFDALAHPEKL